MTIPEYLGRFPFLEDAREAVGEEFNVEVVYDEAVLSRAIERVRNGVDNKTTKPSKTESISAEVNLLSYPVARILVSILDDNRITSRYAEAEARTAINEYLDDTNSDTEQAKFSDLMTKESVSLEDICEEYDIPITEIDEEDLIVEIGVPELKTLSEQELEALFENLTVNTNELDFEENPEASVRRILRNATASRAESYYRIPIESYVQASAKLEGEQTSLSNMLVTDGEVYVSHSILLSVLEKLVYADIMENLPVDVPEEMSDNLKVQDAVDVIRHTIDEQYFTYEIDEVNEERFPPCIKVLLDKTRKGESLEHNARFALASFLVNIGMTTDEILELFGGVPDFVEDTTRYQINHIRGEVGNTEYTSPSCATMVTQGLCVNKDDLCEHINHPLSYYRIRLQDYGDADELADDSDDTAED